MTSPGPPDPVPPARGPSWTDLGPRLISAAILVAVIATGLYFGGYVFAGLAAIVFGLTYREWEQMVTLKPLGPFGMVLIGLLAIAAVSYPLFGPPGVIALIAVAMLVSTFGDNRRAIATWVGAGAIGAAIGPGLGGLLTELVSWQSIFLVQVPVAIVAGVPLKDIVVQETREWKIPEPVRPVEGDRPHLPANLALAMVSASIAATLFLIVLMLIEGWLLTPIVWLPQALPAPVRDAILTWNPFAHLIAVMREPLLNSYPAPETWLAAVGLAVAFVALGAGSYALRRRELAFWL